MLFDSSEEISNNPQGNNINNLTLAGPVEIQHDTILYLLIAITVMKAFEVCYVAFRCYQRKMKKRYTSNHH